MKKKVIIDFSQRWLKAAVCSGPGLKKEVTDIILEPVAQEGIISVPLSNIINRIGRRKSLEVTVVLSRDKITLRRIDLPSRVAAEIEQMLSLNVIRQVPYPKEEIIWGYRNLGFDGISLSNILLAIVHRQTLKNIFDAFMAFNILPEAMLMSSQGVVHYLNNSIKDKQLLQEPYLVLDIDYNFSDLILADNQGVRSSLAISQGSQQIALEDERPRFVTELKQALFVFNNEIPGKKPRQFFLTGAVKNIEAWISGYLEKDFNLKFQPILSPEIEKRDITKYGAVSFAAALGFTYQRKKDDICFVLPEAQIKKEIKLKVRQLLILGVCFIYIFILLGATVLVKLGQLESYRGRLSAYLSALKQETKGLDDIAQKVNITMHYHDAEESVLTYIYDLVRLCPADVSLTEFSWEWKKVFNVRGYALQMQDVFNFVSSLDASEVLKGAQARYTRRRKVKDKEMINFEIGTK